MDALIHQFNDLAQLMVTMGTWDHMKNHWHKKDTVKNYKLNIAGIVNGRRESRRLADGGKLVYSDELTAWLLYRFTFYDRWTW